MVAQKRLLFVYAHPDDESFGSGGTIARYAAAGVQVDYICATNGDAGTVAPQHLRGFNSIAALRLDELRRAAAILGLHQTYPLGYHDSGMMNTPDNANPTCLWQAPQPQVTRQVVELMRQIRPQVVVTFNRYGGYGHPDHIAIQRATTEAFYLCGDATYVTESAPYTPHKLYYSRIALWMARIDILRLRLQGQDPRRLGKNKDVDRVAVLEHVEPQHCQIDVRAYFDVWQRANDQHRSQLGGGLNAWPLWARKIFAGKQTFTRVHPAPPRNRVDETDFFAGVRLD